MRRQYFLLIIILLVLVACERSTKKEETQILVAIASSLAPAISEIAEIFESENKNVEIILTPGASSSLSYQIKAGAPIDVFISASKKEMDYLASHGKIIESTRKDIISNSLVLIQRKNTNLSFSNIDFSALFSVNKIAIGNPETVPVGSYAKQSLIQLTHWEDLKPHFVFGKDARQVLLFVETGNAEMGIVFLSDAKSSGKINIIQEIDETTHSPILYPGAVINGSRQEEQSTHFLDFMMTDRAQAILKEHGFTNIGKDN